MHQVKKWIAKILQSFHKLVKNINTSFRVFLTEFLVLQQKCGQRHEARLCGVELVSFERFEELVS